MYRPSGLAIVTGLAGLGLSYVVWSWDTRPLHALPQQASVPEEAPPDLGGPIQLHSAAWRSLPLPVDEAPTALSEPPPGIELSVPAPADMQVPNLLPAAPALSRTVRTYAESVAVSLHGRQPATPDGEPPVPPPAAAIQPAASISPTPEGRMALAGPKAEAPAPTAPHEHRQARPLPERAPEVETPPPSENRFGPAVFKDFERNGF